MKKLIILTQFLTRIPLPFQFDVKREDLSQAVIYFPVVGGIIGGLVVLFYWFFNARMPKNILFFLIVFFQVLLSGGLHLDGLADSFDGLFSNRSKEKILMIMKDPNVGTFGLLSILFFLGLKYLLLINSSPNIGYFLFYMPVVARFGVVLASKVGNYARNEGMGNLFIGQVSTGQVLFSGALTLVPAIFVPEFLAGFLCISVATYLMVKYTAWKINGITGDSLGAIVEINEVLFLVVMNILGG